MSSEQSKPEADLRGLLEAAIELPGSVGDTYRRLYQYSTRNCAFFYMQGIEPQPCATYKGWQTVDRHVRRGAKAYWILRPITIKLKDELDDEGQPKQITKFKEVKAIFPIEDTEGEPLPKLELPDWSRERALGALGIREVAFQSFDGNTQGYSAGRELAINPSAKYPVKTWFHEVGHIVLGHTVADALEDYRQHRGIKEFEAEGTSYLTTKELDLQTDETASVSREYMRTWLRNEKPSDRSISSVLKATDVIVKAGREIAESFPQPAEKAS